jgi:hypothetical protein
MFCRNFSKLPHATIASVETEPEHECGAGATAPYHPGWDMSSFLPAPPYRLIDSSLQYRLRSAGTRVSLMEVFQPLGW